MCLLYEILFGGYATPTKCVAFWRLALNSYLILKRYKKRHSVRTSEMAEGECLLFCVVTVGLHDSHNTHFGTQINIRNPFCHSGSPLDRMPSVLYYDYHKGGNSNADRDRLSE